MKDRRMICSRREFVGNVSVAATAGLLGFRAESVAAEPPPETTTFRWGFPAAATCNPQAFVALDLLKAEGFADVQMTAVQGRQQLRMALASGSIDLNAQFVGSYLTEIDAGAPIVLLAGSHGGCFELFVHEGIRSPRDLKGKSVAVIERGSGAYIFFVSAMKYLGLDAHREMTLVEKPARESMPLFVEGKIDAFMAFGQEPAELRTLKVGRVLLSSTQERPWSQYFCCMFAGNRDFVQKHPIATKRALRALLKANDVCALEPAKVAEVMTNRGIAKSRDIAIAMLRELPYREWRRFDAESTVRFYALRMRETGLIKSTPQKILAHGADWRFLNELKKELKG
jgi:NitT/TauT family transport system substrate-binding protein